MFNTAKEFMIKMFQIPVGWQIWLVALMLTNIVTPLFFLSHVEAQVIFAAINIGFITGVILYQKQGFTRLLGLMHWTWIPLVIFLVGRLGSIPLDGAFGIWIRVVILLNSISLILDAVDVAKYLDGDREPIIV